MNASQTIEPDIDESRKPPGPRGLPIVGNALNLGSGDILEYYMDLWREYGDIVFLKLGPLDGYTLFSPDFTHHVLVKNQKNYIKGIGYDGPCSVELFRPEYWEWNPVQLAVKVREAATKVLSPYFELE